MHQLDISLDSIGYACSRQLLEFHPNQPLPTALESVCHYYDIVVPDSSLAESDNSSAFSDFEDIVTSAEPYASFYHHDNVSLPQKRRFVKNNERRNGLIQEFMHTEISYLNSLRTFKSRIADPLRLSSKDKDGAIIGQYECTNIFMNIDELIQVSEQLCQTLLDFDSETQNLGDLLLSHMNNLGCYNKYLLGVHNARVLNEKQMKNPRYVNFLKNASSYSRDGNQTVYDYLVLPGQRIGRYAMMLKELIKHTTDNHAEMPGLCAALSKAGEIANMRENVEGELMKVFHSLLQYIHHCPESLMSYQRRLLYYLDVAEIDSLSLKPIRPMTIFLFSDKLMIAKRPSYDMDGLELCGLEQRLNGNQKEFCLSSQLGYGKLKFVGWAHLSELSIHCDPSDVLHNLTLAYTDYSSSYVASPDTDEMTQKSLEAYFHYDQLKHCFSLSLSGGNLHNKIHLENLSSIKSDFIYQFGKSKQDVKHNGSV
ncbi:Dbl homology domain-containing protein [Blakeslea trispora]|nr:Dbl homology domain-containing protein [Blakeslea trispora]